MDNSKDYINSENLIKLNKVLRFFFIVSAIIFLVTYLTTPKTDCQACSLEYNDLEINGYKAFEIFEEECISYNKPTDTNQENINITNISFG